MSNDAYLYAGATPLPPDGNTRGQELIASADYLVPVLWLALFEPDDFARNTTEDPEYPEDDPFEQFAFSVSARKGAERCRARAETLRATIANIDDFLPAWLECVDRLGDRVVTADVTEVALLSEAEDPAPAFRDAVAYFDSPTERTAMAFTDLTSLRAVYDADTRSVRTPAPRSVNQLLGGMRDVPVDLLPAGFLDKPVAEPHVQMYITGSKRAAWVPWV